MCYPGGHRQIKGEKSQGNKDSEAKKTFTNTGTNGNSCQLDQAKFALAMSGRKDFYSHCEVG